MASLRTIIFGQRPIKGVHPHTQARGSGCSGPIHWWAGCEVHCLAQLSGSLPNLVAIADAQD